MFNDMSYRSRGFELGIISVSMEAPGFITVPKPHAHMGHGLHLPSIRYGGDVYFYHSVVRDGRRIGRIRYEKADDESEPAAALL